MYGADPLGHLPPVVSTTGSPNWLLNDLLYHSVGWLVRLFLRDEEFPAHMYDRLGFDLRTTVRLRKCGFRSKSDDPGSDNPQR